MKNFFFDSNFAKNILPKSYSAIMLFGFVFSKKCENYSNKLICHEGIHISQYKYITIYSLLINFILLLFSFSFINLIFSVIFSFIIYYIWYFLEYIIKIIILSLINIYNILKNNKYKILSLKEIHIVSYKNISFEREAYLNQHLIEYKNSLNKEYLPLFYKYILNINKKYIWKIV